MTAVPQAPARATAREWCALAVLMIPVLLVSVDNTVLSFALPAISASLHPSGSQLMWIVDIYALMLAGLLIAMGSLGDRLGRRRLLLIGSAGFGVASVLAAWSTTAEMLILARALLGVAGATLMPSTLSLIRNLFADRRQRRLAVAIWAAMFSGGAALGPVLGGWLLEHFWWGSVFLINVPLIVGFWIFAVLILPESRDPNPGPLDLPSVVLSLAAMMPLVLAIKKFAEDGLGDTVIGAILLGLLAGWAFVRRQRRLSHPMIDIGLFGDRVFSGAITANLLSLMGLAGFLFFAAQYLQLVAGLSPMRAAMVLVPGLVATVLAGLSVVRIVERVPVRLVVSGAFLLSAAGFGLAAFAGTAPAIATMALAFAVLGIGIGFAETITNDLILSTVPPHRAGAASAISETAYEVGAVLGTAVLGSVLLAVYRSELVVPAEVSVPDAGASAQTLGGAVETASRYPDAVGEQLLSSARHAFASGVEVTCIVAMVIALAAAWVSWRALRAAER